MIYYPVCSYNDDTGELDYLALLSFNRDAMSRFDGSFYVHTSDPRIHVEDFIDTLHLYDGDWWLDEDYLNRDATKSDAQRELVKDFFKGMWK